MAYRGFIEEVPAYLKRTALGTFDFRGRSTRTEVITFYIASQLLSGLLVLPLYELSVDLNFEAEREVRGAVTLLLTVPLPALLARRAHDVGQSGWLALLLLVALVTAALSDHGSLHIVGIAKFEAFWLDALLLLAIIGLWAVTLLPPTPEANRYGLNPRLDEAELTS